MKTLTRWMGTLPTEYQLVLVFAAIAMTCWLCQPLSPILASSFDVLLTFLGTLSGGFLTHGILARRSNNCQDLIGNTDPNK